MVFVAIWLGAIFAGPLWAALVAGIVACIGVVEYLKLADGPSVASASRRTSAWLGGAVVFGTISLVASGEADVKGLWLIVIVLALLIPAGAFSSRQDTRGFASHALTAWVYVCLPMSLLTHLGYLSGSYEPLLILGYFLVLWTNDTGAYLTGLLIGRHKLFPRISPNKTWEGLAGGVLLAFGAAWLMSEWIGILDTTDWMGMGFIVACVANGGDLFESALKRHAGVKDSGRLMPGHGGVLDRFDGMFFSLPVFLACYHLFHL